MEDVCCVSNLPSKWVEHYIVDCLDNGNNKKALQEADKVLKKQKDFLCVKVKKVTLFGDELQVKKILNFFFLYCMYRLDPNPFISIRINVGFEKLWHC